VGKYQDMITFQEFNELIGLQDYLSLEEKYKVN